MKKKATEDYSFILPVQDIIHYAESNNIDLEEAVGIVLTNAIGANLKEIAFQRYSDPQIRKAIADEIDKDMREIREAYEEEI